MAKRPPKYWSENGSINFASLKDAREFMRRENIELLGLYRRNPNVGPVGKMLVLENKRVGHK